MVQHDIHDDMHPACMGFIDETSELAIGIRLVGRETRVDGQEMLDAVTVIRSLLPLAILQDGAQPNRANPETLQIAEASPYALQRAALEPAEGLVPARRGRVIVVVETVNEKEVDPAIPPILRRGERADDLDITAVYPDRTAGRSPRAGKCTLYLWAVNRICHQASLRD